MKQFTLHTKEFVQRPIIILDNFFFLDAMLDTGAVLPVWVEDEETLRAITDVPF